MDETRNPQERKTYIELNKIKIQHSHIRGTMCSLSSAEGEIYSNKLLHVNRQKSLNLNSHFKKLETEKQNEPKTSRRKGMIKNRNE